MQIFLTVMNLILVWVIIHQGKEIRDLERKTLDAFRVVCNKWIIENMEEESRKMDIEEKTRQ